MHFPLFFDIRGKKCVVIGGGDVALRKVRRLLDAGAEVTVISPECSSGMEELAGQNKIRIQKRTYEPGDIEDALIVLAATPDGDLNARISRDAKRKGIWINAADNAGHSDFILPSSFRRGDFVVAVSTSGMSPALARKMRIRLEREIGEEYAALTSMVADVRQELKRKSLKISGEAWQQSLDIDHLLKLLRRGKRRQAKQILVSELKKHVLIRHGEKG